MNLLILSMNKGNYSTKRLVEEATAQNIDHEVINPLHCFLDISSDNPMVYFKKRKLNRFNIVLPRIGASVNYYSVCILRQFEMMGIYCVNSADAIERSRNKLRSMQLLFKKKLPLPKSSFANSTEQTQKLIALVGGPPTVVKLLEGSQGRGVVLGETQKASECLIDAFRELDANFLVQEFIKEANGSDLRCFVVGDKVVAAMMRTAKEGEFRANIHRGGYASKVKITPEERRIAVAAAKALKLNIAGVDLIRTMHGPKILEVNSTPGLEGIEKATGLNVAKKIIEFALDSYHESQMTTPRT